MTADWSKFLSSDEDHALNLKVLRAERCEISPGRKLHPDVLISEIQGACRSYDKRPGGQGALSNVSELMFVFGRK